MDTRLGKSDWLRAARLALLHHGPDGVRVESLARDLGVTKGSFYWHFTDRSDLLEALLAEWEAESSLLIEGLNKTDPREALRGILDEVKRRTLASERGEWPSDVAIFAWAGIDPDVARRVNRTEEERMQLLRNFAERPEMADFLYYAYQGFLVRRRRIPKAVKDFDMIARLALELLPGVTGRSARKTSAKTGSKLRSAARKVSVVALLTLATGLQGCTTYRILRWRDPAPNIQRRIFPERIVHRADSPFQFAVAAQRTDLDTISVRDVDAKLKPFGEYLKARRIRAFVVIRNDTILYERYLGGYEPSDRWSSFSVAKSVASAVLGLALDHGIISSLDDPVTKYLPELARNPAYRGVTLRHLMEMKSGLAYTRATGENLLTDLRSSDAHFYYTTNMKRALSEMRREFPPPAPWAYKDSDVELLGWILAKAAGKPVAAQLEEEVWRRIGTEYDASFSLDHPGGLDKVSAGFNATARDYARFGRLYLNGGSWNGVQLLPRDWVKTSTTLDTTRTEPEVTTWYRMQHNHLWWLPMHNWSAERDFYADGSRGQRIYVHPPTHTIIVQLADDSNQDFPFRKIAHYLAGESYKYPRGIAGLVRHAVQTYGSDSARVVFRRLTAEERKHPEGYFLNQASLLGVAEDLMNEGKTSEAVAIYEVAAEHYSNSCAVRRALVDAYRVATDPRAKLVDERCPVR
jgi:CubicO group peptidase (beta-lactamase class C family)/AcrR family transcriptional regulator